MAAGRCGVLSGHRKWWHALGTAVKDYLSLAAEENLPYGPGLGFRCDSATQYRFAQLIWEYMNAENVDGRPDIRGFEDIVVRIKAKQKCET